VTDHAEKSRAIFARRGFDFTLHMRRLCADFVARLPQLAHIDLDRIAICFNRTRRAVTHGVWASLTPLRFAGGSLTTKRGRRQWTIQRLYMSDGREMLYILRFYIPRFFDQPFEEKLATVVHELWHVSPTFDGDLRRHEGRCFAHGASQKKYDEAMHSLVRQYLATHPDPRLVDFLRGSIDDLLRQHGGLHGIRVPRPKLIAIADPTGPSHVR
jgi:predicted metallopeptidase